jgi:hypothetical protein
MSDEQADNENSFPPMDEAEVEHEEETNNELGILDEKSADVAAVEAAVEAAAGVSETVWMLCSLGLDPTELCDVDVISFCVVCFSVGSSSSLI